MTSHSDKPASAGGRLQRYLPHAIFFVSCACIMVVELVASRLIASHLGSSLYTWTAVIAVLLAGIMVGNVVGGRVADRRAPRDRPRRAVRLRGRRMWCRSGAERALRVGAAVSHARLAAANSGVRHGDLQPARRDAGDALAVVGEAGGGARQARRHDARSVLCVRDGGQHRRHVPHRVLAALCPGQSENDCRRGRSPGISGGRLLVPAVSSGRDWRIRSERGTAPDTGRRNGGRPRSRRHESDCATNDGFRSARDRLHRVVLRDGGRGVGWTSDRRASREFALQLDVGHRRGAGRDEPGQFRGRSPGRVARAVARDRLAVLPGLGQLRRHARADLRHGHSRAVRGVGPGRRWSFSRFSRCSSCRRAFSARSGRPRRSWRWSERR